ncbi:hypothetical protein MASR1M59_20940 [Melaminivora sp.]
MYKDSFDGTRRASSLIARIGAEERVGDSLSPSTIIGYVRKIVQIAVRASINSLSRLPPETVVRDIENRVNSKKITQATARLEKSAALFWIAEQAQGIMDSGSLDLWRYEAAYSDILAVKVNELPKSSKNTSSEKAKAFSDEAVKLLIEAANVSRSEHLFNALLFTRVNLYVGLRPVEWLDASFVNYLHSNPLGDPIHLCDGSIKSSPALVVRNAKHSAIRGNGEMRTILLDKLDQSKIKHVQEWLKFINKIKSPELMRLSEGEIRKKVYDSMQRAIRNVLNEADWQGEKPTIYSTRHQAVANARADGLTQKEIAALFGHSSTNTARRHYGKKNAGYSGRSMRPAPESIWAVRSTVAVRPKPPRAEPPGLG